MRTIFLFVSLTFTINFVFSQTEDAVNVQLNALVSDLDLSSAGISFRAIDLKTDSVIAAYNPDMCLAPASTTKLFTTAAAFKILGKNYRPKTILSHTGSIDSLGTLHGSIIITGNGDPTLGSRFFSSDSTRDSFFVDWVQAVQNAGIKRIDGTVIADASSFGYHGVPSGWTWGDMGNYYGAGPNGLVLYDNMCSLYFTTGDILNGKPKLDSIRPEIPFLSIDNRVKSTNVRGDQTYVFGAPYSNSWFIEGELPLYQSAYRVRAAIPDPELFMAISFYKKLKENGISAILPRTSMRNYEDKKALWYDDTTTLLSYSPHSLEEIAYFTNHNSVNLFAEELLCLMGFEKTGFGSTENGLQVVENFWNRHINIKTMRLTDGSGLSRSNAIASLHFTELLKYMRNDEDFIHSLPIAGKSGTLTHVCNRQAGEGRIIAKSGTLSRVKAYAGYVNSRSGRKLAFAIIVNNYQGSTSHLVDKMERIFNAMALL